MAHHGMLVACACQNVTQNLPDDPAIWKAMNCGLQAKNAKISATLRVHDQLFSLLRIAKFSRSCLRKSSEKDERRDFEQLGNWPLEDLLTAVRGAMKRPSTGRFRTKPAREIPCARAAHVPRVRMRDTRVGA